MVALGYEVTKDVLKLTLPYRIVSFIDKSLLSGFETEELGNPTWQGGETEALARLERHLQRKAWVASFAKPKMSPQSLLASPCGLSPYLRFGCLSTRNFYHRLTRLYISVSS